MKNWHEVARTDVIYANLNPVFNDEEFDIFVHDKANQILKIAMFDWDSDIDISKIASFGADECLGHILLDLEEVSTRDTKEIEGDKLIGVEHGSLSFAYNYLSLAKSVKKIQKMEPAA